MREAGRQHRKIIEFSPIFTRLIPLLGLFEVYLEGVYRNPAEFIQVHACKRS